MQNIPSEVFNSNLFSTFSRYSKPSRCWGEKSLACVLYTHGPCVVRLGPSSATVCTKEPSRKAKKIFLPFSWVAKESFIRGKNLFLHTDHLSQPKPKSHTRNARKCSLTIFPRGALEKRWKTKEKSSILRKIPSRMEKNKKNLFFAFFWGIIRQSFISRAPCSWCRRSRVTTTLNFPFWSQKFSLRKLKVDSWRGEESFKIYLARWRSKVQVLVRVKLKKKIIPRKESGKSRENRFSSLKSKRKEGKLFRFSFPFLDML